MKENEKVIDKTTEDNVSLSMFKEYPDVVSIDDLQSMLKIGRNNAYALLKENKIKSIRIGKKYIIPKISVAQFVTTSILT